MPVNKAFRNKYLRKRFRERLWKRDRMSGLNQRMIRVTFSLFPMDKKGQITGAGKPCVPDYILFVNHNNKVTGFLPFLYFEKNSVCQQHEV